MLAELMHQDLILSATVGIVHTDYRWFSGHSGIYIKDGCFVKRKKYFLHLRIKNFVYIHKNPKSTNRQVRDIYIILIFQGSVGVYMCVILTLYTNLKAHKTYKEIMEPRYEKNGFLHSTIPLLSKSEISSL